MESVSTETKVETATATATATVPVPVTDNNTIGGIGKDVLKKYGFYALIIVIIIILIYIIWRFKESYLTESVRSDADREGWDLRKSIDDYLKLQDNELKKFSSSI